MLSIIIPTKNEADHIAGSVGAVQWAVSEGSAEVIVVDNQSDDGTQDLAEKAGARVVTCGPERSAQRNRGGMVEAEGDYILFLDADMYVKRDTLAEILEAVGSGNPPDAMFVREVIEGGGYWNRVRNFERSFYDGTCIDALRVFRKDLFKEVQGYDESLCGPEDWDLDRRVLAKTQKVVVSKGALVHDEGVFSLLGNLKKKSYYSRTMPAYREKWNNDSVVRKQLGIWYRFLGVFVENSKWRRAIIRPDLMLCVWFYRVLIGFAYLARRKDA